MDIAFGSATDPFPFITAAYTLGAAGILGYAGWVVKERMKLRTLLATIKGDRIRTRR